MKWKLQLSILIFLVAATIGGILYFAYPNLPADLPHDGQELPFPRHLVFANWESTEHSAREIDYLIEQYERTHPGVQITNLAIPFDQYEKQLVMLAAGGKTPDVIQLNGNMPALLGAMSVLEPLDDFVRQDVRLSELETEDVIMDAGRYLDSVYTVPLALNPLGLWYNKALMEQAGLDPLQPPSTLEELEEHLSIIQRELPDVYGIGIDTTNTSYALTEHWPFFQAFGTEELLRNPDDPGFNSPAAIRTLEWMQRIQRQGYTPVGKQIQVQREMMAHQQIVYKIDGPYLEGIMRKIDPTLTPNAFDETFGVTPVPKGANDAAMTVADTYSLGMSRQSGNKRLAWDFIHYMIASDTSVENYILPMGMIPSLRSMHDRYADELSRPHMQVYLNHIIPSARTMPYDPHFSKATQYILTGFQEIFRGDDPAVIANQVNKVLIELYKEPVKDMGHE